MDAIDALPAKKRDPIDDLPPKAGSANPMDTAGQLAPNDRAQSAAKAVRGAIGKGVGAGLDLIDAPRRSNMAAMARDIAKKHGTKLTNDPTEDVARAFFSPGLYDKAPGPVRGIERGVMDFINDPVSVLGVTGLPAKGVEAFDRFGLPLANKIGDALNKTGNVGQGITETASGAHNFFSSHGAFKRQLARDYGPDWLEKYSKAWGAKNATIASRQAITNTLTEQRDKIFNGLSDTEHVLLLRAIKRGKVAELGKRYPELVTRAAQYKELTDTVAHLRGSKALQQRIEKGGFTMPDYGKEFAADRARGIQRTDQYRQQYVPELHDYSANIEADPRIAESLSRQSARRMDLAKTTSSNLKRKNGNRSISMGDLPDYVDSMDFFIKDAANNISGADMKKRVADTFGRTDRLTGKPYLGKDAEGKSIYGAQVPSSPKYKNVAPSVKNYLKPEIAGELDPIQKVLRGGNQLGNAGLFYQPFPHMRNIATLGAISNPAAAAAGMGEFAKSGFGLRSPAARAAQFRESIKAGSVGVENREAEATKGVAAAIGSGAAKFMEKLPGGKAATKVASIAGKPIRYMYDVSGKMLWGFDDAMNHAATQAGKARGQSPERAAYESRRSLVDYNDPSPAVELGKSGLTFSTFRQKMPIAVARSIAKNPQFAATLLRANPMLGGAKSPDANSPTGLSTMTTPLSEANELFGGDPLAYGRGSVNSVGKLLGNIPANALLEKFSKKDPLALQPAGQVGSKRNFFTYNQPDAKFIASQIPYVGTALDQAGLGLFPKKPGEAFMQGITGVRPAFPEGKENAANTKLEAWLKEHPNHTYGEYLSYLRGQKSARRYAR